jgi:hypothetical protein
VRAESHDRPKDFAGWADEIWERARGSYAIIAARDASTLNALYPPTDPRFLRVRTPRGWALALDTRMHDHKQFGDMRVGTIVDGLGDPAVIRAATGLLEARGVDLIISNQLHRDWSAALLDAGFRRGPSNYLFAASPALAALAANPSDDAIHINRGDGDGPIHL